MGGLSSLDIDHIKWMSDLFHRDHYSLRWSKRQTWEAAPEESGASPAGIRRGGIEKIKARFEFYLLEQAKSILSRPLRQNLFLGRL